MSPLCWLKPRCPVLTVSAINVRGGCFGRTNADGKARVEFLDPVVVGVQVLSDWECERKAPRSHLAFSILPQTGRAFADRTNDDP